MAKILTIRYTLQEGSLPNGVSLDPDTGRIMGAAGWDALGEGPEWTGPDEGSLGAYDEGDVISEITFTTDSTNTPIIYSLPTTQDRVPWGLSFNPLTGVLSGTIAPLFLRTKEVASTSDGPTWDTAFGKLAGYDEDASASIQISATPIGQRTLAYYQVVDGALPWGLKLDPTSGVISGTVAALKSPGAFVDVPALPLPEWQTDVNLGSFNEYESVAATLMATPAEGRSMAKYVLRSGALPWGLKLNQANGQITGTLADLKKRNEPVYYDSTKDPVISDTLVINGANSTVVNNGSIGSFAKGDSVLVQFSSTVDSNRALRNYWLTSPLPWGLKFNGQTGEISGTITNNSIVQSKTYTFVLNVADKNDPTYQINRSSRTYNITVQ